MEITKKCFKCFLEKPLSEYYKHKEMADGHLNKCKDCCKHEAKIRYEKLIRDKEWVNEERKRHRDKYHRLGYKDKHKPTPEMKKEGMRRYRERYPEKYKAKIKSIRMPRKDGYELHHWSYNEIHYKDVIELSKHDHNKAHRFIVYDPERMMYRRFDTNELLDTRSKHESFIMECIEKYED